MGKVNTGMGNSELNKIPILQYGVGMDKQDDDTCTICFEEYKHKALIKKLDCDHYYHSHCIDKWLKTKKSCPICKERVSL